MSSCILCDGTVDVEKRFIIPRHRDPEEGVTAKRICERCHDQYHWKASNVARRRGSAKSPGYGYRTVNGRIIPIPEQIETIDRIIELRNSGSSWNAIADILNDEHRPTRNRGFWYAQTVCSIYARECPASQVAFGTVRCKKSRYGWTDINGELAHDDDEQSVIRWMLHLRENGATFEEIAHSLNDHGVPSKRGGKWHSTTVSNIVRRGLAT